MRHILPLTLALAIVAGAPAVRGDPKAEPPASAQPKAPPPPEAAYGAEVMVLHATHAKKGVDPRIGDLPELKDSPFSFYESYELLTKARLPLKKNEPRTLTLPNGRVLQTNLVETLPQDTVLLAASINQPNGKDFLPLLKVKAKLGQAFIVAGQKYKSGILVLVIRVVR
jgi:hypothetical protein